MKAAKALFDRFKSWNMMQINFLNIFFLRWISGNSQYFLCRSSGRFFFFCRSSGSSCFLCVEFLEDHSLFFVALKFRKFIGFLCRIFGSSYFVFFFVLKFRKFIVYFVSNFRKFIVFLCRSSRSSYILCVLKFRKFIVFLSKFRKFIVYNMLKTQYLLTKLFVICSVTNWGKLTISRCFIYLQYVFTLGKC